MKNMSLEDMLLEASQSSKMEGWNDHLSWLVGHVMKKYALQNLCEQDLELVAAGKSYDEGMKEKNEKNIQ